MSFGSARGTFDSLYKALDTLPKRPVDERDAKPIRVDLPKEDLPFLHVTFNKVICNKCKAIVQERYFSQHQASGACSRIEKKGR